MTMKASELIEKLNAAIAEHGDLDICANDDDGWPVDIEDVAVETPIEHWISGKHMPQKQVFVLIK